MGRNKSWLFHVLLFFLNILPSTTHSTIILGYYKQKFVKNWVGQRLPGILTISLSNFIIADGFMIFLLYPFCQYSYDRVIYHMFNCSSFNHLGTTAAHPFVFLRYSNFYSILFTRRGSRIKRFLCLIPHQLFSKDP